MFAVQVQGARVDLGEVEAALRRAPRVRDAVVLHCATTKKLLAFDCLLLTP